MRRLDEIRKEMADSAYYYSLAKEAGVQSAMDRHEAVYGALAWVLEEPWDSTGEFEKTIKQQYITTDHVSETETTIWSDNSVTHKHRTRTNMATTDWSEWKDGKGE